MYANWFDYAAMEANGMNKEILAYVVPNNVKSASWTLSSSPYPDNQRSYRLWMWYGELSYAGAPLAGIGARLA